MSIVKLGLLALLCSGAAAAQGGSASVATLAPQTTLPIEFTRTLDASHGKAGDPVVARTCQAIRLSSGQEVKAGAQVVGHVLEAQPFVFDKTPYSKQKVAVLTVQFDALLLPRGEKVPLHIYLRALADTFATTAAFEPRPSDEDPLHSTTQIGGDILTPSQNEIVNRDGDVVGYNKRGGAYAHLIANTRPGAAHCDESSTEQPMAMFSASACGLYGFGDLALTSTGLNSETSSFTLTSFHHSPEIHRGSTALLEVVPTSMASTSR